MIIHTITDSSCSDCVRKKETLELLWHILCTNLCLYVEMYYYLIYL